MNNKIKKLITTSFKALVFLMLITTTSFAWFVSNQSFKVNLGAKSIAFYFDDGKGTSGDPYILTKAIHVYNLSWLQNNGFFQSEKTYFKLDANIDMKGKLMGDTKETGAVPPIGTEDKPFLGSFDGNGKVISNLWVSSYIEDWRERPTDLNQFDTVKENVGFFGTINQNGATIGEAKDFILENLEVTTNINASNVGLIAGLANGQLKGIGVKNGVISVKDANGGTNTIAVSSETSLIGKVGENVSWVNRPTGGGNELRIDPTNSFSGNSANTIKKVPDATDGNAFYVGTLKSGNVNNPQDRLLYKGNNTDSVTYNDVDEKNVVKNCWDASCVLEARKSGTITTVNADSGNVGDDLWNAIKEKKVKYINPGTNNPSFTSLIESGGKSFPNNVIWFKPLTAGTCSVAVTKSNNSADIALSIYSFKRTNNTTLDTSTLKELVLYCPGIGNGGVVVFKLNIPESMVEAGYEFAIGKTMNNAYSANTDAGFVYLILPGAGFSGGQDSTLPKLQCVDYAFKNSDGTYDVIINKDNANYLPKNVVLNFENSSFNGSLYYNTNAPTSSEKTTVNYCGEIIDDKVLGGDGNIMGYTDVNFSTTFPSRLKT